MAEYMSSFRRRSNGVERNALVERLCLSPGFLHPRAIVGMNRAHPEQIGAVISNRLAVLVQMIRMGAAEPRGYLMEVSANKQVTAANRLRVVR